MRPPELRDGHEAARFSCRGWWCSGVAGGGTGAAAAMPVIGALQGVSAAQWVERMAGFHRGLGETGYVEGRNVAIEYRWADGQFERLPAMATDLVGRKVSVIFAGSGDVGIHAAMAATKITPIVFLPPPIQSRGFRPEPQSPGWKRHGYSFART